MKKSSFSVVLIACALLLPQLVFADTASTSDATSTDATPPVVVHTNVGIEAKVRSYFADIPVMASIAKCESGFRQFDSSGNPLHGGAGGTMVGIFQIDAGTHTSKALSLGFDINTVDGNLGYTRFLYSLTATDPWISSFPCWNPLVATTSSAPTPGTLLTKDLTFGMVDPQVLSLQQLLNKAGYTVATDGPGSSGNETTKFGALTRVAVRKFQCDKGIACSGDEFNSGYGLVESKTRAVILALTQNNSQTSDSTSDEAAKIASLQSQIASLMQIVLQLTQQLALLKNQ